VVPVLALAALLAFAIFGRPSESRPRAFAEAGTGTHAIVLRDDGGADTVLAVDAMSGETTAIATVPHLEGYTSFAAVSPSGDALAVVAADLGTPARPLASLVIVDLATGAVTRLLEEIDQLQQPLWSPDGAAIFVTRTAASDTPATDVSILRVAVAGGPPAEAMLIPGAAGAYPVGFDANGRLLVVAITGQGSVMYREGGGTTLISAAITRDWRVSPDGRRLAFIEANTAEGLRYQLNVIDLDGGDVRAQSAAPRRDGQQLGVAWHPQGSLAVGQEPGTGGARAASAGSPGFDVPLSYSPDGTFLAVAAWSGSSFARPGSVSLQVVGPAGRVPLADANRFAGWAIP
jgi:dipeptidyl aminopeptidase/acylaminoacyl peptidase